MALFETKKEKNKRKIQKGKNKKRKALKFIFINTIEFKRERKSHQNTKKSKTCEN